MRYVRLSFITTLCLLLSGCGMYVIHKSTPQGDHTGVPFFVKAAACKHEVARLEPYFVMTLTTKMGDKVQSAETTTLSRTQFNSKTVLDLRSALASATPEQGGDIRALWDAVRALHYEPHRAESQVAPDDWFITSDTVTPDVYVDYGVPYTLNVRTPLIGSAKADVKLADDGTLTEASAEKEDKTISELFPIKELIKGAAGIVGFDAAGTVIIELAIEEKGVKFTRRYRIKDLAPPCTATAAQRTESGPYDLIVEDVGAAKKESDDDSISVSGSIKLPKAKGSKGADEKK
ncbi:MAG TPA: hypothetical protein VFA89_20580 [Terriglobales bacterium]|nr:hypothetical protein [Terriglobales bacterium]